MNVRLLQKHFDTIEDLLTQHTDLMFALGDTLNEVVEQGIDLKDMKTYLSYENLKILTRVARTFPKGRREPFLTFKHYEEVINLGDKDQILWLARAKRNRWTAVELRQQIRTSDAVPRTKSSNVNVRIAPWAVDYVRNERN